MTRPLRGRHRRVVDLALAMCAAWMPAAGQEDKLQLVCEIEGDRESNDLSQIEWLGDVNGDGVSDLAVNGHMDFMDMPPELPRLDSVLIVSGADGRRLARIQSPQEQDGFGSTIARVADVDGDGIDDVLLGSPWRSRAGLQAVGVAEIVSPVTGDLLRTHQGSAGFRFFGELVEGLGDVDGDGVADYAVSESAPGEAQDAPGRVCVYSGKTGHEVLTVEGEMAGSRFGRWLDRADALDGDGAADFFVATGEPGPDVVLATLEDDGWDPENTGIASSVAGISGRDGHRLWTAPVDNLGWASRGPMAAMGDVSGDGHCDVAIVAQTSPTTVIRVFSGTTGRVIVELADESLDCGQIVLGGGSDLDGDGTPDLVVGMPDAETRWEGGGANGRMQMVSGRTWRVLASRNAWQTLEDFGGHLAVLPAEGPGARGRLAVSSENAWDYHERPAGYISVYELKR